MEIQHLLAWLVVGSFYVFHSEAAPQDSTTTDILDLKKRLDSLQEEVTFLHNALKSYREEVDRCNSQCKQYRSYREPTLYHSPSLPFADPNEVDPKPHPLKPRPVQNGLIEDKEANLTAKDPSVREESEEIEDKSLEVSGNSEELLDSNEDYYEASCEFKFDPSSGYPINGSLVLKQKMKENEPVQISGRISGFSNETDMYALIVHENGLSQGFCSSAGEFLLKNSGYTGEIPNKFLARNGQAVIDFRSSLYDLVGDRPIVGKTIVIHPHKMACCVVRPTKNIPSARMNPTLMRFNG